MRYRRICAIDRQWRIQDLQTGGQGRAPQARVSRRRRRQGGCDVGRGFPLPTGGEVSAPSPENFLTLDRKMSTSSAFWALFFAVQLLIVQARNTAFGLTKLAVGLVIILIYWRKNCQADNGLDLPLFTDSAAFCPLAVSPPRRFAPCLDVSPPGWFAIWTIRLIHVDVSPPACFAQNLQSCAFRPLDVDVRMNVLPYLPGYACFRQVVTARINMPYIIVYDSKRV